MHTPTPEEEHRHFAALELAKQMYTAMPVAKPDWDQLEPLGGTQSLWLERAEKALSEKM